MSAIDRVRNAIRRFESSIPDTIRETVERLDFVIIDYISVEQLFNKGEDGKGNKIEPPYTQFTVSIKMLKGQPTNRVTLEDTGAWKAKIKIVAESDKFRVTNSDVELTKKLMNKYSDDILKVQRKYLDEFVHKFIIPALKRKANEFTIPTNPNS